MAIKAKKLQSAKVKAVSEAKGKFEGYSDYIFANYRGLTVLQITDLRKKLREKNCEFHVVKNNFARIAFEEMKAPDVSSYLKDPTAVALAGTDANEVAKILFDFAKEVPALSVKGGLIANTVYDAAMVEAFSKLPGRKQLLSMLLSAMNGPAQNLVYVLNAVPTKLVRTLQAVADKKAEA
ncbi:MAG: 50S ribosomal protein L10 [Spirochaetaceae bacterium]|jgi:large subunit ribosomal protein L10|nr:50S ribosomal protein L10 [Spirochaetaceae bacterium]